MTITNNTQNQNVDFTITYLEGGSCGTLHPGEDKVIPYFDNKPTVKVILHISQTGDQTEVVIAQPGL